MKKKMFTVAAVVLALIFWFFDSSVHYFVYDEPQFHFIPDDINELWMRAVIVLLIVLFGVFSDYFTLKIMYRQKQMEVAHIFGSLIHANRDVLDNLLKQMKLFRIEAQKSRDFDRDVIKYYDNAIEQASDLVVTLLKVEEALHEPESAGRTDES